MIIVAGGSGTRMGANLPKQFIELNGTPILMHTIKNMHVMDVQMQLIVVLPQDQMTFWNKLCAQHQFQVSHQVVAGGVTRFVSVRNGLQEAKGTLVGIHDGVRPFVSADVVEACFAEAERCGAAIPVVPIVQSLRQIDGRRSKAVDRSNYRAVQTPQCFQLHMIRNAFEKAAHIDYSDDATVMEAAGHEIALVGGNSENIKITSPIDLELARLIVARRKN